MWNEIEKYTVSYLDLKYMHVSNCKFRIEILNITFKKIMKFM